MKARSGQWYRHFLAASYEAFWARYVAREAWERNIYEVLLLRCGCFPGFGSQASSCPLLHSDFMLL